MKEVFIYRNKNKRNCFTVINLETKKKIDDVDNVILFNANVFNFKKLNGFRGILYDVTNSLTPEVLTYFNRKDLYRIVNNTLTYNFKPITKLGCLWIKPTELKGWNANSLLPSYVINDYLDAPLNQYKTENVDDDYDEFGEEEYI